MIPAEREATIVSLIPLVHRLARTIAWRHPSLGHREHVIAEGVSDGYLELCRLVDEYDPAIGPLDRFASSRIFGAILNGIRSRDTVPERVRRTCRIAERIRYELAVTIGIIPTDQDLEHFVEGYRGARTTQHRAVPLSLDSPLPPGERVSREQTADPAELAIANLMRERLEVAIENLPARERDLILSSYYDDLSLHEIARRVGVSAQRMSQLHLRALRHLKAAVA